MFTPGAVCQTATSRSASTKGSGLSRTPLTTLKIVTLAAMPTARVMMATVVNSGTRMSRRAVRAARTGSRGMHGYYGRRRARVSCPGRGWDAGGRGSGSFSRDADLCGWSRITFLLRDADARGGRGSRFFYGTRIRADGRGYGSLARRRRWTRTAADHQFFYGTRTHADGRGSPVLLRDADTRRRPRITGSFTGRGFTRTAADTVQLHGTRLSAGGRGSRFFYGTRTHADGRGSRFFYSTRIHAGARDHFLLRDADGRGRPRITASLTERGFTRAVADQGSFSRDAGWDAGGRGSRFFYSMRTHADGRGSPLLLRDADFRGRPRIRFTCTGRGYTRVAADHGSFTGRGHTRKAADHVSFTRRGDTGAPAYTILFAGSR